MTFWDFLSKHWPKERAWIVLLLAILIGSLLKMADNDPSLWKVELFKTLLTAAIITGALNMVLAFHFTANQEDENKTENTREAFKAIQAARGDSRQEVARAAEETADAAEKKAEEYRDA